MPRVLIVGCGSYMNDSYDCAADWKCLTAAAEKRASFKDYDDEVKVVGFLRCSCPGRALVNNVSTTKKRTDFDVIHLTNCMAKAIPMCKNHDMEALPKMLEEKTGVKVVVGTHDFM